MVCSAQQVLRKVAGNWTFAVVLDRVGLGDQIAHTPKATGAVSAAAGDRCHASIGAHLRELLRGNQRYRFARRRTRWFEAGLLPYAKTAALPSAAESCQPGHRSCFRPASERAVHSIGVLPSG